MSNQIGVPLPPLNTPITNPDGTANMLYYQWFLTQQIRTGGSQGISSTTLQTTANNAQSTATSANNQAQSATSTAVSAQTLATTANTTATTALTLAQTTAVEAIIRSELVIPIAMGFSGGASTLVQIYQPIVSSLVFPQNLGNMAFYCGSRASTTVKFQVGYIRGGFYYTINTFQLPAGTNYGIIITGGNAGTNLQQGDTMVVQTLNTDLTLSNWYVTFACSLP